MAMSCLRADERDKDMVSLYPDRNLSITERGQTMKWPDCINIPCGKEWMDCPWYDPDCCDEGECIMEDAALWEEAYNLEDDTPLYTRGPVY